MRFVFNQAVKSPSDGYNFTVERSFSGSGPWVVLGREYQTPDQWLQYAQKTARALGITDAECGILPRNGDESTFTFSFKNTKDGRTFIIAAFGDEQGESGWNHNCTSPEEKSSILPLVIKFIQTNEIDANIINISDTKFRVVTHSQFDHFSMLSALEAGQFYPPPQKNDFPPLQQS